MKKIFLTTALAAVAFSAVAATPTFNWVRTIAITGNGYRAAVAIADSTGGVFYSSNALDHVYYMADPLTAGPSGYVLINDFASEGYSGGSVVGLAIDPAGTLFGVGADPTKTKLYRFTPNTPTWNREDITLPVGVPRLGGCAAVGTNRIVATNLTTGQLHFYTISGNTATEDAGSPVAAPAGFTGYASNCAYDSTTGKIYVANSEAGIGNGGVYVATTNGTAAGTSFPALNNPFASRVAGQNSANSATYQSVSIEPTLQVLATNRGNNAVGQNRWRLFDASASGPNVAPYQEIDWTETGAPGALAAGDAASGHTFFKKNGGTYLLTTDEDSPRNFVVYAPYPASVSEWSVY